MRATIRRRTWVRWSGLQRCASPARSTNSGSGRGTSWLQRVNLELTVPIYLAQRQYGLGDEIIHAEPRPKFESGCGRQSAEVGKRLPPFDDTFGNRTGVHRDRGVLVVLEEDIAPCRNTHADAVFE